MTNRILVTDRPDGVVDVVISNIPKRNALTVEMWLSLANIFESIAVRSDVRCVLLSGDGHDAFSAGADIGEFAQTRATVAQIDSYHETVVGPCLKTIGDCPVPVVARLRGHCMGGGLEIASMCDLRLADTSVRVGAPVGRLGFALAFGETQALFNLFGAALLTEILIGGRILDAREAAAKGLLTLVVEPPELDRVVEDMLAEIVKSSAVSARMHKQQIRRLLTDASPVSYDERAQFYSFAETEDYQARTRAFLAKQT
ncbi:enoyl-CoA hydratase [Nitrobacteraceae bacterium AZCC 2161]